MPPSHTNNGSRSVPFSPETDSETELEVFNEITRCNDRTVIGLTETTTTTSTLLDSTQVANTISSDDLKRRLQHLRLDAIYTDRASLALSIAQTAVNIVCEITNCPELKLNPVGHWTVIEDHNVTPDVRLQQVKASTEPSVVHIGGTPHIRSGLRVLEFAGSEEHALFVTVQTVGEEPTILLDAFVQQTPGGVELDLKLNGKQSERRLLFRVYKLDCGNMLQLSESEMVIIDSKTFKRATKDHLIWVDQKCWFRNKAELLAWWFASTAQPSEEDDVCSAAGDKKRERTMAIGTNTENCAETSAPPAKRSCT